MTKDQKSTKHAPDETLEDHPRTEPKWEHAESQAPAKKPVEEADEDELFNDMPV